MSKDDDYKIGYNEFIERVCALGNRNHSPFKSIVQRLAYFIESNRLTVPTLLKRLSGDETSYVTVAKFAEFLKAKVEKKKEYVELIEYARLMDVDKDGAIGEDDITACLRNINSSAFYRDNGASLAQS